MIYNFLRIMFLCSSTDSRHMGIQTVSSDKSVSFSTCIENELLTELVSVLRFSLLVAINRDLSVDLQRDVLSE